MDTSSLIERSRARICKRLRIPEIDFEETILPGWESMELIPGLLKRLTNTGSEPEFLIFNRAQESIPRNQFRQAV